MSSSQPSTLVRFRRLIEYADRGRCALSTSRKRPRPRSCTPSRLSTYGTPPQRNISLAAVWTQALAFSLNTDSTTEKSRPSPKHRGRPKKANAPQVHKDVRPGSDHKEEKTQAEQVESHMPTKTFHDLLREEAIYRANLPPPPELDQINKLMSSINVHEPTRKPRFPIVLCHGLYGFSDVPLPALPYHYQYWADLLNVLRDKFDLEVYAPRVPGTATVKERAEILHQFLVKEEAIRGREVNLIAHSMGGLDCRYLLTHIRPTEYNPVSLTTLATPHRGSEFMSWCRDNIGVGKASSSFRTLVNDVQDSMSQHSHSETDSTDVSSLPYSLKSPLLAQDDVSSFILSLLDSPGYSNLTPAFLESKFNPSTPNRRDIKYYSVAARAPKLGIWHPLWLPKLILDSIEVKREETGEIIPENLKGNDALVTIESARWGEFLGTIENADHWDLRGHSGFSKPTTGDKKLTATPTKGESKRVILKKGVEALTAQEDSWAMFGWPAVNTLIRGWLADDTSASSKSSQASSSTRPHIDSSEPFKGVTKQSKSESSQNAIAEWIFSRLPPVSLPSISLSINLDLSSFEAPDLLKRWGNGNGKDKGQDTLREARLLYGIQPVRKEKFSLERFYQSLCRKLYNEGF